MRRAKDQNRLPPLPSSVYSILGPVPVQLVPDLKDSEGSELLGKWCPDEWCIKLLSTAVPLTQWVTLYHEWLHVAAWDAGIGLKEEQEERVCDALSSFLFAAGVRI